jgi:hypothetical protein
VCKLQTARYYIPSFATPVIPNASGGRCQRCLRMISPVAAVRLIEKKMFKTAEHFAQINRH